MITNFPKVTEIIGSRLTPKPTLLTTTLNRHSALESVSTLRKGASVPLFPLGPPYDTSFSFSVPSRFYWHSFKAQFKSPLLCELFLDHASLHGSPHPLSSYRAYSLYHSFGIKMSHTTLLENYLMSQAQQWKPLGSTWSSRYLTNTCWFCGAIHLTGTR